MRSTTLKNKKNADFTQEQEYKFHTSENSLDKQLDNMTLFQQSGLKNGTKLFQRLQARQKSTQKMYDTIIPEKLFLGNRQAGYRAFEKILKKEEDVVEFDSVVTVFYKKHIEEYFNTNINNKILKTMPTQKTLITNLENTGEFYHLPWGDLDISSKTDGEINSLCKELDKAVDFIQQKVDANKKVLIHCNQGASRSATVTVAYLIKNHDLTVDDAINHLRHCRPCVEVSNFKVLLNRYSEQIQLNPQNSL